MPPTVFISYSHNDEIWKDRLLEHLGALVEEGHLQTWDDRDIGAGDEWFEAIQSAMKTARVAVFLVSASSLKSKFIRYKEIPRLLERRQKEGMTFFPVIVKACVWEEIPWLTRIQARPKDGKPLARLKSAQRDAELANIAKEILRIIRNGSQPSAPSSPAVIQASTTLLSLHQLPPPPPDFTGREEDLDALRSALTQGGTGAIFGLRGSGGVGKTTLALKLAEELASRYPDAQFHLDLKGLDLHPLTAAEAMAHVIRSFYPKESLPENETDLTGFYRSVLFDKRTLLLMDNAASREQVEPLMPPAGSLLLVTSRFHFTLPGIVARNLDEMSQGDARDLLLKLSPRIANKSDEIARLCGRLPLALRLAGSALAERLYLSPSKYARRLREGQERLDPVEASINLSYELLSPNQRPLWRMLTVFPGTFAATAAAAVWELESDLAQEALWGLVGCSLVEWEEKEERYRLHDLARQFADGRIEAKERDTAQQRHARHYLRVLRDADDFYLKGGEAVLLALRLFDTEWSNIQAGFTWAASRVREDDEAAKVCGDYPDAGTHLLNLRQHPRERIRWRETALAAARQRKDKAEEGLHLRNLGLAYADIDETRRAIEFYEQALAIARDMGDRRSEGKALGNLGNAYADLGETRRAIEFHEQVLTITRDIGDRRSEGKALGNLGNDYADLGETRRAIEFYEQRLGIARDIGDRRGEGIALNNLGLAYADLGESGRAIEYYEQCLPIVRELGDRFGEVQARWNLGEEIEKEGDLARAADLMQVLVDFEREIGHHDADEHAIRVQSLRARIAGQSS